jgi:nitroreductase
MSSPSHVVQLLQQRLSTRAIAGTAIEDAVLDDILEAARLTPSCRNKQPWRFSVLRSEEARSVGARALMEGNRVWASRAPLLLVGHARKADDCELPDGRGYHRFDLGMAVMNLMLAATGHGLVARPMAGFDPEILRDYLGLDADADLLVMLALGLPGEDDAHVPAWARGPQKRERKSREELIRFL